MGRTKERTAVAVLGGVAVVALAIAGVAGGVLPWFEDADTAMVARAVALPAGDVEAMDALLVSIEDPIVRQAALTAWMDAHAAEQGVALATPLCERLEGAGRVVCLRKAASPHLTGHALGGEPHRATPPLAGSAP